MQYKRQDRINPDGSFSQAGGDDNLSSLKANTLLTSSANNTARKQRNSATTWEQVGGYNKIIYN